MLLRMIRILAVTAAVATAFPGKVRSSENAAQVQIEMPVAALSGDTVVLHADDNSPLPETDSISFSSDEESAFTVTLQEPGVYRYSLTDGEVTYNAVVTVFWEAGVLQGVLEYYEEGEAGKKSVAVFSGLPQEETDTHFETDIVRTGDDTDIASLTALAAFAAVSLGICAKAGSTKRRNRNV